MFVKKKTEKDLKNKPRILFSPHVCPPCHVTSPITQSMCLSWWKQNEPQRVINYQMQKWNGVGSVLVVTSEVSFLQVPHCFCHDIEAICLFPEKYWRSTWFTYMYMWWGFSLLTRVNQDCGFLTPILGVGWVIFQISAEIMKSLKLCQRCWLKSVFTVVHCKWWVHYRQADPNPFGVPPGRLLPL